MYNLLRLNINSSNIEDPLTVLTTLLAQISTSSHTLVCIQIPAEPIKLLVSPVIHIFSANLRVFAWIKMINVLPF